MEKVTTVIYARGHRNIQATHRTTFEVTKASILTKRGDCVVAVKATKGALDLEPRFKIVAQNENAQIEIKLEAGELDEIVRGWGSPLLQFTHTKDLVVRKSNYVCGRTLAIRADKAAMDLSREFVEIIMDSNQQIKITLTAKVH